MSIQVTGDFVPKGTGFEEVVNAKHVNFGTQPDSLLSTTGLGSLPTSTDATDEYDYIVTVDAEGNHHKRLTGFIAGLSGVSAWDEVEDADSAIDILTTLGNITLDAQGTDSDIIFKVDDGDAPITALTLDGSNAGKAMFNDAISTGGMVQIVGNSNADGIEFWGLGVPIRTTQLLGPEEHATNTPEYNTFRLPYVDTAAYEGNIITQGNVSDIVGACNGITSATGLASATGITSLGDQTETLRFGVDAGVTIIEAEGTSDNAFEVSIRVTNPTADRTISFPDETGTLITTANIDAIWENKILSDVYSEYDFQAEGSMQCAGTLGKYNSTEADDLFLFSEPTFQVTTNSTVWYRGWADSVGTPAMTLAHNTGVTGHYGSVGIYSEADETSSLTLINSDNTSGTDVGNIKIINDTSGAAGSVLTTFQVTGQTGTIDTEGSINLKSSVDATCFHVNTDKFTINGSNGNTAIAGTLDVTGTITHNAGVVSLNSTDVSTENLSFELNSDAQTVGGSDSNNAAFTVCTEDTVGNGSGTDMVTAIVWHSATDLGSSGWSLTDTATDYTAAAKRNLMACHYEAAFDPASGQAATIGDFKMDSDGALYICTATS